MSRGAAYRWYSDRWDRVNDYSRAHAFFPKCLHKEIVECLPQEKLFLGPLSPRVLGSVKYLCRVEVSGFCFQLCSSLTGLCTKTDAISVLSFQIDCKRIYWKELIVKNFGE